MEASPLVVRNVSALILLLNEAGKKGDHAKPSLSVEPEEVFQQSPFRYLWQE